MDMTENRLPDQRDITTEGGNYNKCIEGNYIQDQKKVEGHHNQAQIINNIENCYISTPDTSSESNTPQTPVKKESETASQAEAMFVLTGKLCAENKVQLKAQKTEIEAIVAHLRKRYNLDLTIHDITEGSVRIKLGGSQEDLEKLSELFKSGKLTNVLGIPVEDVQLLLNQSAEVKEERKQSNTEVCLSQEEVNQAIQGSEDQDFRNVSPIRKYLMPISLILAQLFRNILRNANPRDADLIGANLCFANLSNEDLSNADLRDANLSNANLIRANLIRANLSNADLQGANVENTRFRYNRGISESMKRDLINRGAIFEDSPDEHSRILAPR